jgi:sugar lactone lactonase YvrE
VAKANGGLATAPTRPAAPGQAPATLLGVDAGMAIALEPDQTVPLDASSLVGLDAGTFVSPDGLTLVDASGKVLGSLDGATLIAAGGQNLIAAGGQNLIAAGGQNLIAAGGQNLIAAGGQNLIAAGGQNLIAAGGQNLIAAGGQNLIAAGGQNATDEDGQPRLVGALMGEVKLPAALARGGKGLYRLASEGLAPAADVVVYVRDAQGRFVVDAAGKPVSTRTDAEGRFLFRGHLAHRGLTCFVPLAGTAGDLRGFSAVRPRDWRTGERLPLDPVSTMLTGWIDTAILGAQPQDRRTRSLNRLTADAASVARGTLARKLGDGWSGASLDWRPATCAAETSRIKQEGGAVAGALEAVQRIMTLAGVDNSRLEGAKRTTVALQQPVRLAVAPDGAVYVAERYTGIVRRFGADGKVDTVLGPGSPTQDRFGTLYLGALAFADGHLYGMPSVADRLYRISADGRTVEEVLALREHVPLAAPSTDTASQALATGRDGSLLCGAPASQGQPARILRLARREGRDEVTVEAGPAAWTARRIAGLAEAADGALWVVSSHGETWLREPSGTWRKLPYVASRPPCDILALPDGDLLCSRGNSEGTGRQVVERLSRDGKVTPFAGKGPAGLDRTTTPVLEAHFKLPAGLAALADGTVLVADSQNGLVRTIKDDLVSTWAGTTTRRDTIAAEATLNLPGGLMVDAQGRVLLTEVGANAVRRLEGGNLTLVAGGELAYADGQNRPDLLDGPATLAPHGEGILICEAYGRRLRKLHPDGRLEVLVGGAGRFLQGPPELGQRVVAAQTRFAELLSVTVDPQGRPVFAAGYKSYEHAQIWRLEDDGSLTWLAGNFEESWPTAILAAPDDPREGKPAKEVPISRLAGLAYDPAGNLYLAEPAAARVFRISPEGVFSTFAGSGFLATFNALKEGTAQNEEERPAREASLLLPTGLAIDAQGNVFIAEVGTRVGAAVAAAVDTGISDEMPIVEGRVRVVTPDGRARILAGVGSAQQRDAVRNPIGVAVSRDGRLYVVDNGTAQLKEIVVTR